jgi:hypothetical protein
MSWERRTRGTFGRSEHGVSMSMNRLRWPIVAGTSIDCMYPMEKFDSPSQSIIRVLRSMTAHVSRSRQVHYMTVESVNAHVQK